MRRVMLLALLALSLPTAALATPGIHEQASHFPAGIDGISLFVDILVGAVVLVLVSAHVLSAPLPRARAFGRVPLPLQQSTREPSVPVLPAPSTRDQSVQPDIVETFLDRGELRQLGEPTLRPNGKRIPGLKLDHPRQLAVISSLVRFSHVAAEDTFTTAELQAAAAEALGIPIEKFPLGGLRYELWKLRAKGVLEKLPHSRRYRLLPNGYRICTAVSQSTAVIPAAGQFR